MTPKLTAETFCFAPAQTLASLSRVRKVVVGRRLHHRAGVHRRRPQGQSSPLSGLSGRGGMAAARWCRFAHPPVREPRSRPIFLRRR